MIFYLYTISLPHVNVSSNLNIDYDPISKPDCLPLSCVQRFITDATRKDTPPQFMVSSGSVESLDRTSNASERVEVKRKIAIKHHSYSMSSSNRSNTPTGNQFFSPSYPIFQCVQKNVYNNNTKMKKISQINNYTC